MRKLDGSLEHGTTTNPSKGCGWRKILDMAQARSILTLPPEGETNGLAPFLSSFNLDWEH